MAKQEKQYLEKMPGGRWRVTLSVPKELQPLLCRTRLKETLNTDSLAQARQLRWPVVTRLKAQIEEARLQADDSNLTQTAIAFLSEYRREKSNNDSVPEFGVTHLIAERAEEIAGNPIGTGPDGEPIYDPQNEAEAVAFYEVATGKATPPDLLFERFKSEKDWDAKTFSKLQRIFRLLSDWSKRAGHRFTIEYFSTHKRVASEFLYKSRDLHGWKANTFNGYVTVLRSYWNWLIDRGYAEANPWERQSMPKEKKGKADSERAFTDDEVCRLLHGVPSKVYMTDLMWIAAFTGARISALIEMRVGDVEGGSFSIPPTKRETEARIVPIHPAITEVVLRRTQGKPEDDWLFPEVPPHGEDISDENRRSNRAIKLFERYRKGLGIDDRRPGDRRSLVNFHSFRRWFITKAFEGLDRGVKGYSEITIKEVVGHKITDITAGTYRSTSGVEARRACVEAVGVSSQNAAMQRPNRRPLVHEVE